MSAVHYAALWRDKLSQGLEEVQQDTEEARHLAVAGHYANGLRELMRLELAWSGISTPHLSAPAKHTPRCRLSLWILQRIGVHLRLLVI